MVCFDEKSKPWLVSKRLSLLRGPGKVERCDYEYVRGGTRNIFLFVEPKAGLRYVRVTRHRKRPDFAQCIQWLVDELYPEIPWIRHFKDQVRQRTRRRVPLATEELVKELNPILRGWGNYYKRAHVRDLFNQLDRWIVQRLWSHQHKHWRCCGWKTLPRSKLYGEYGLVNLIALIPSMASQKKESS